MMDREEIQKRIQEEEDYVRAPKFSNSLTKFLAKNSEGIENAAIARLLMITEEEVEAIYADAISQLQEEMLEEDDDRK